ncbi:MAG: DUF6580 family putative transport protein [Lacipirellulaceae bacterium]
MPAPPLRKADVAVFALLVAIGVVGRWGQPDWCVTPMAAVGLFAGRYFGSVLAAAAVPLVAMLISDLALPGYASPAVLLAVYAAMLAAPLLGRWLRKPARSTAKGLVRLGACAAVPSLVFFLVTNFAVWTEWSLYEPTLAGLGECYVAALPFARRMLAGDLAYTALVFGAAALAGVSVSAPAMGSGSVTRG